MLDQIQDKAKKGYLGSFGSTELRFKAEKVTEVKTVENESSQPRFDPNEDAKKPSHYFVSRTEKVSDLRESKKINFFSKIKRLN